MKLAGKPSNPVLGQDEWLLRLYPKMLFKQDAIASPG
jgi:hypothetical protein